MQTKRFKVGGEGVGGRAAGHLASMPTRSGVHLNTGGVGGAGQRGSRPIKLGVQENGAGVGVTRTGVGVGGTGVGRCGMGVGRAGVGGAGHLSSLPTRSGVHLNTGRGVGLLGGEVV